MNVNLYRAANSDRVNSDVTCFARRRSDAAAYLDNPGFGGATLYRAALEVEDATVLDIRDGAPEWLAELAEQTGAATLDWIITSGHVPGVLDGLRERGIRWVILTDTYPAECETWVLVTHESDYYGDDVVEPAMLAI